MVETKSVCVHHEGMVCDVDTVRQDCRNRARVYMAIAFALLGIVSSAVGYALVSAADACQSVEVYKARNDANMQSVLTTLDEIKRDVRALREHQE